MPGANLSAYAHLEDDLRNSLFVLMEHGQVIETITTRKDSLEAFGARLAEYIKVLGLNPARIYAKQWGSGLLLHRTMEKNHGIRLAHIEGNEVIRRADIMIMGVTHG